MWPVAIALRVAASQSVGIGVVELAGLDQRGDDSPVFRPGIVSGEEGVLSVQRDGADGPLDGVAIELDPAIGQEQAQAVPVFGDVLQGLAQGDFVATRAR